MGNSAAAAFESSRSMKQPRRSNHHVDRWGGGQNSFAPDMGHASQFPPLPPFDPNNPMEAMLQMQAMGLIPPFQPPPPMRGGRNQGRRRGRCRDFDRKGYCSRGVNCQYDHGSELPFVPPPVDMLDYGMEISQYFTEGNLQQSANLLTGTRQ